MSKPLPRSSAESAPSARTVLFAAVPSEPSDPQATLDRILADPPIVHPMEGGADPRMGVWSTDEDCYRLIASRCPPGTRSLETGSGLSTVLLAALGAQHICCTAGQEEADRILAHCRDRGIDASGLTFEIGSSSATLPPLEASGTERDLVLIYGSHAFPLPMVDWFYGASLLVAGGTLVVDDVNLPAVRVLKRFLDQDPRWVSLASTSKWAAWRRTSIGPLSEDWTQKTFNT